MLPTEQGVCYRLAAYRRQSSVVTKAFCIGVCGSQKPAALILRSDTESFLPNTLGCLWRLFLSLQIDINDERIVQTAKVFRLVDIVEEFPLTGEERSHRRRDLRRGCLYGKAKLTPSGYCTRYTDFLIHTLQT